MHKIIVISSLIFSTLVADNSNLGTSLTVSTNHTKLKKIEKKEKLLTQELIKVKRNIKKIKEREKKVLKKRHLHKKRDKILKKKHHHQQPPIYREYNIIYNYYNTPSSSSYTYSYIRPRSNYCDREPYHHNRRNHHHVRRNITRMQTSR